MQGSHGFLKQAMLLCILAFIANRFLPTAVAVSDPNWKIIGGKVKQLDISPRDSVWGVNRYNYICTLNGKKWKLISGRLKHVSTGEGGVWGVNVHDRIYYRTGITYSNPAGAGWTRVSGLLKQIDSGPYGIVCGVNRQHNIYCRVGITVKNPLGSSWVRVPGRLKYVSCGRYGCWGVNKHDFIYFREGIKPTLCKGTNWVKISGRLKQLEVDSQGNVYGVNSAGNLYIREGIESCTPKGLSWRRIASRPLIHISAGYSKIMTLDTSQSIFYFEGRWSQIPGALTQIDNGLTSAVWGVNVHHRIYRLNGDKSWQRIPGLLKHVSTGEAGVWGVNRHDNIYHRFGVTENRPDGTKWIRVGGKLKQIDSGPGNIVYGLNAKNRIYCRTGIELSKPWGTGWKQVSGALKYISCGTSGCWGVNSRDRIYYRSGVSNQNCAGTKWIAVGGLLKQIEVGANGSVYGVNRHNQVYRRVGVTELNPLGTSWSYQGFSHTSHITTGLNGEYVLIAGAIYESSDCPRRIP